MPKFGTGKLVKILVVWEDRVLFMEKKRAKVRGVRDIQTRNYEGCQHPDKILLVCKAAVKLISQLLYMYVYKIRFVTYYSVPLIH